ncbi:HET-domain-containing protein [Lentithecium fluviatile CBS 122367]|uniref:HET-domain-containing protein n=1 Tax=Lentithecium fluviatile CBS 122367 TaxID=1168545 RepID=A0A6G1II93_9PLEO|nr:HET-domain-containing protein [Lentithecium fluviatile CBS 122367]
MDSTYRGHSLHRSMSGPPEYKYLGIDESSSIRLLTLQPGLPQDAIRVTLTQIDMDDKHDPSFPLYECLSYTWGDNSDRLAIYVDNKAIEVTRNLAEALVHLRHYEIPRVMWVDALCINQGDMKERSTQVARMSDIYSRATRVTVWLGLESQDSALAMNTMIHISEAVDLNLETQTFTALNDPGNWVDHHNVIPWSTDQIDAICNLFSRPWFERLWVWQEIRLGNANSLIMVGQETMLWRRFYVAGFFLRWKREFALRERYFELEPRIEIVNGMMNNITQSPMATLSLRTCYSKCTEPRDRVYALMGITTDEVTLKPDYSWSVGEVYKDVALQHLKQLENLELLSSCSKRTEPNEKEGLPTWAPDWRIPNQRKRWFDLVGAGEPAAAATYHEPGTLLVSGVAIDTIASVTPLPFVGTDPDIFEELRQRRPSPDAYPHGPGTQIDAYLRTLFANEFTERYKPAGELLNFQNYDDALTLLSSSAPLSDLEPKRITHFVRDFKIQTADRSLATTDTGYIALVPTEAQAGDVLVRILGTRWPMVLRPYKGDSFAAIGFTYVNGDNDRESLLGSYPEGWSGVAMYDAPTGKWWPMAWNETEKRAQIEDPRLGPLPDGWKARKHKEDKLWNWYVKDGEDGETLDKMKKEIKMRSDPRLSVDALKARGVNVQDFCLV